MGSSASEQELPLLDSDVSLFTGDGTVDFHSRPARRARSGRWVACLFIIGYEIVERLAYYGISANLVLYIKNVLHEGTASASESVNNWGGAATVLPIFGALIADAYLGRYRTIAYLSAFYVLGLIMLTLSASIPGLKPNSCSSSSSCPKATSAQLAFFFVSLYLIAIGTAGVKPCLEAFGADQFDEEDPTERKSKSSFFNWWYFGLTGGAFLAFTVIVYIEDNASWGLGYGILATLITIASSIFLMGTPFYRNRIAAGSSLVGFCKVLVAAVRNWHVVPDESLLYECQGDEALVMGRRQLSHTTGLRCLDKAATMWQPEMKGGTIEATSIGSDFVSRSSDDNSGAVSSWKLCTVTQVEEVKLIVRIIPIWLSMIVYGLSVTQGATFFVQQAATMDRNIGAFFVIPSGSLLTFLAVAILVVLPIYDRVLVPCARRFTGRDQGLTLLQRMGFGYFLSIFSMGIAALVERRRLDVAKQYGLLDDTSATIPMSVFWLAPQYLIFGISDVFALVGEQEFFYDQVPDSMRSLGMALFLCANGLASYLGSALIIIVDAVTTRGGSTSWFVDNLNRCHLDYYYWLLAILFTVNFVVFLVLSWCYTYKEVVHRERVHE
ncbi:hypothetical protein L7F22_043310 [Adiantum nelumboides]|nr:hypothetical protein [Adiantum nelumboides]